MKTLVDYRRRHVLKISKSSGSGFGRKYREPMWYVLGVGQLKKGKKTEQDSDEWRKWKNNWTIQHEQTDHGTLTHTKLPTTGQHCIIIGRGGYITTCVLGTGISCCVTYLKINEKHNERIETRSDTVLRNIVIYPSLCTAAVIRERTNRSPRRIMVGPITVRGMEYTYVRESCCYMLCNDRESQHRAYVPGRAVRTVRRGERKKKKSSTDTRTRTDGRTNCNRREAKDYSYHCRPQHSVRRVPPTSRFVQFVLPPYRCPLIGRRVVYSPEFPRSRCIDFG